MNHLRNQLPEELAISNANLVFNLNLNKVVYIDDLVNSLINQDGNFELSYWRDLIHKEDLHYVEDLVNSLLAGKPVGAIEFRLIRNEKTQWLNIVPMLIQLAGDRLLAASIKDITNQVENAENIARFANKKNSVLHMLSHDLRGPLQIASSLIAVLERDIHQPTNLRKTSAISQIIKQSIDLIEDLTNREFLETTESPLFKKRVNIVRKLNEYIEECKNFMQVGERIFEIQSTKNHIEVALDEAKFMQVINNLLTNALKFTHPGGSISILIDDLGDRVCFTFTDNGIGIPQNLLPYIFDRNTVARREGLKGEPTNGVGLSIVKEIIAWHQGSIICESQVDEGSKFVIILPKEA